MAYGVMSFNSGVGNINMLPATVNRYEPVTSGSSQMDMLFFSDFVQVPFSTASPSSGGLLYGANANGGSYTINSTTDYAAVGVDACIGVLRCATGTTNNNTGYAAIKTADAILAGIPTPTSGYVTKYEWECLVETDTNIFGATRNGAIRFGMMATTTNTAPTDGVYFEFLYDGTTNDTTWNVVFRKDGSQERVNTTVTVAASKLYRLYMCVEKDTSGTYTTTYKIKNVTDATNTESTAAPSNAAVYYPAATTDYMGVAFIATKAGTATTNSTFVILDYMTTRIRRKLNREMVILG
jgi:hypothetical protein